MILRDYQDAAVEAVWRYWLEGKKGNPLVVMPTGTGKSVVIARLIETMLKAYPSTRILNLTHVKELIDNNYKTLLRLWPSAPAGIFSAGLGRKDIGAQVTFGGIGSVRERAQLFRNTDLIFVDEAHLISNSNNTGYRQFISTLQEHNPYLKVVGLTATHWRLGQGSLIDPEGENNLFDDICIDMGLGDAFVWFIDQGYLSPIIPRQTEAEIDVDKVHIQAGEFVQSELTAEIEASGVIPRALLEARELAHDRDHWLVFAPSLEHTEKIAALLNQLGVKADFVHSKMSGKDRDSKIAAFKAGATRALVNKDILTTGFDYPAIDCIVMLRPTNSSGLWVQMLGRGTRPVYAGDFDLLTQDGRLASIAAGPKENCLVLDFAGNTKRLGPINYPTVPKRRKKSGERGAPVRVCPDCDTILHISVNPCTTCGHEFPRYEEIYSSSSKKELILRTKPPKPRDIGVYTVTQMVGTRHIKQGRPDSVKVDYHCGVRRFTTWVSPQGATGLAKAWWYKHSPEARQKLPFDATELLGVFASLRCPTHIKVDMSSKYPEVVDYDFSGRSFASPDALGMGGPGDPASSHDPQAA